ncbi:MAG: MarR family transcriptional regulator [Acholeplasmatales bacterium]|nr:MarR family transcriptional regulator [Acholeplasmatales bacterium]
MEEIGSSIGRLHYKIKREIKNLPAIKKLDNVSSTNGIIIMFIYEHKDCVSQKDIEKHFGLTRSTVSKVITAMEAKNLVKREPMENNQKQKRLVLTDEAIALSKKVIKEKQEFEKKLKNVLGDNYKTFIESLNLLNSYFGGDK